jgi:hypothetical protein
VIRPAEAWRDAADPLIRQIRSGPFVAVLVPDDATGEEPAPAVGAAGG